MRFLTFVCVAATLTGCVQFPDIDDATDQTIRDADHPTLIPLDPVLSSIKTAELDTTETQTQLETRAAGLNARAAALRRAGPTDQDGNRSTEETE